MFVLQCIFGSIHRESSLFFYKFIGGKWSSTKVNNNIDYRNYFCDNISFESASGRLEHTWCWWDNNGKREIRRIVMRAMMAEFASWVGSPLGPSKYRACQMVTKLLESRLSERASEWKREPVWALEPEQGKMARREERWDFPLTCKVSSFTSTALPCSLSF